MANSQRVSISSSEPVVDDYPVRPNTAHTYEKTSPTKSKSQLLNTVLFSFIFFLYGWGVSLHGLLYPEQARNRNFNSFIYGSVIATSHLVSVLTYPVAGQMVSNISSRNSLSVSVFVIGACRVLFGTVTYISEEIPFIVISFAIQIVEGFAISMLIASTVVTAFSGAKDQRQNISLAVQSSLCLGLGLGPIGGKVLKQEFGFDISFYTIGSFTVLGSILAATLLREQEQQVLAADMPIIYWMKNKKLLIYFLIIFMAFNYVGFLSISLEKLLMQFHLNSLNTAMIFSILPFVYGLSFPVWTWIIKKGFNSVMLIFIAAIIVSASLVLVGPAPFTFLKGSLKYVCWALVLGGFGIACKSACVLDASVKDIRYQKRYTEIKQQLLISTVFMLAVCLGYSCGSLTAGFTNFYIGYSKGTLPLFGLEICTAITAVVYGMSRNYVSKRRLEAYAENEPILRA